MVTATLATLPNYIGDTALVRTDDWAAEVTTYEISQVQADTGDVLMPRAVRAWVTTAVITGTTQIPRARAEIVLDELGTGQSRYRTVGSLASATGLLPVDVQRFIDKSPAVRRALFRQPDGSAVYASSGYKTTARELLAFAVQLVLNSYR